jgi:hypothetical protein
MKEYTVTIYLLQSATMHTHRLQFLATELLCAIAPFLAGYSLLQLININMKDFSHRPLGLYIVDFLEDSSMPKRTR